MAKTIRQIIEDNHDRHPWIYDVMDVDTALSSISKLILEAVGEDEKEYFGMEDVKARNNLRAEIRANIKKLFE